VYIAIPWKYEDHNGTLDRFVGDSRWSADREEAVQNVGLSSTYDALLAAWLGKNHDNELVDPTDPETIPDGFWIIRIGVYYKLEESIPAGLGSDSATYLAIRILKGLVARFAERDVHRNFEKSKGEKPQEDG